MAARVTRFIEKATSMALKEKLALIGQPTAGVKNVLKLRLEEAIKDLSTEEIDEIFPINLLEADDSVAELSEHETLRGNLESNEDENLNTELQNLRERLVKKQEILELRRKISQLTAEDDTVSTRSYFNFRDVEESLNLFSGEDSYCIKKWISNFEESAEVFGWDSRSRFIYAKRLMTGTAKLFLRTTSLKSWSELKTALLKEFSRKVTNADVHNELRNRKKKREESFQMYVFSMQEIASLGQVEEADIINYIINGISDTNVNKMLLYNANTMDELKNALRKYEKIKLSQFSYEQPKFRSKETSKQYPQGQVKCFNCNERGHTSNKCSKPKHIRGSCFRYGKPGHGVNECTSQGQVMNVQNPQVADRDEDFFRNNKYLRF